MTEFAKNVPDINAVVVRVADWQQDKQALIQIRKKVFIEEQNVPIELEWDGYDEASSHYIASLNNRLINKSINEAIACARLKPDGQIGRMAVLPDYRNHGIGTKLLKLMLQDAADKNVTHLYLHAQLTALPFYQKQGFIAHGEIFYEADIAHRKMIIAIRNSMGCT